MLASEIQQEEDILHIDFENRDLQKEPKDLHVGWNAKQMIRTLDLEGTHEVRVFRQEVRMFYVNALKYIKAKFPFQDKIVKHAVILDPSARGLDSLDPLFELLDQLPADLFPTENRDQLITEYRQYQASPVSKLPPVDDLKRIDAFWTAMGQIKDPSNDKQKYELLTKFAKYILMIPHSNSFSESLFSMVKKITTDTRSQLGRGREGKSNESVYCETYDIRNTLCGILACKINIFKDQKCYNWEPGQQLLIKAKKATYKALNSRSLQTQ